MPLLDGVIVSDGQLAAFARPHDADIGQRTTSPSGCHLEAEALEIGIPDEGIGRPRMSKIDDALGEPLLPI